MALFRKRKKKPVSGFKEWEKNLELGLQNQASHNFLKGEDLKKAHKKKQGQGRKKDKNRLGAEQDEQRKEVFEERPLDSYGESPESEDIKKVTMPLDALDLPPWGQAFVYNEVFNRKRRGRGGRWR